MDQGDGKVEPALHAAGVGLDAVAGAIGQLDQVQRPGDPLRKRGAAEPLESAEEGQVLAAGQVLVDRQSSGERPRSWPVPAGWQAGPSPAMSIEPPSGRSRPTARIDGGGLAGPVGSEQAEDLAGMDFDRKVVYRSYRAEPLGQVAQAHHTRDSAGCRHPGQPESRAGRRRTALPGRERGAANKKVD